MEHGRDGVGWAVVGEGVSVRAADVGDLVGLGYWWGWAVLPRFGDGGKGSGEAPAVE